MDIVRSLNPDLYAADDTMEGAARLGLIMTEVFSGDPQTRDYSEGNRRTYQLTLGDFDEDTLRLAQWEAFLEKIGMGANPFRFDLPIARRYSGLCYPKGDNSNVWFDLPGVFLPDHGILVMEDDAFVAESGWTYHGPANVVPNWIFSMEEAVVPTTRGFTAFGSCSLKFRTGASGWGLGCIFVDVTGTAGNVGFIAGEDSTYGEIPVDDSTAYTAAFAFLGAGEFRVKTQYYQADRTTTTGSLTTGSPVVGSATVWRVATVNSTSPADAAFVRITCERTTSSSNDFLGDCVGLVPQDYPFLHYPGCAPDVIEFGSAPAENALIWAGGNATALRPRVRFVSNSVMWSLRMDGLAQAEVFRLLEAFD